LSGYTDRYWWSSDGLRLHCRDYAGGEDGRPPLLCLPGLTRNARDFEGLANRLAGQWRVICPEFRGRGESAYAKDPMSYVPLVYQQDINRLVEELQIDRFVAVGTSLGGLVTMLIAATHREWLAGALLNDVGPVLEAEGLARIRTYVGVGQSHQSWVQAARAVGTANAAIYPGYDLEDWLRIAKRQYKLNSAGRIVLDYDMRIADPLRIAGGESGNVDLWPIMQAFVGKPMAVIRGEASDILSAATAQRMIADVGATAELCTVPGVGHAPTLDEPEACAAIDRLLAKVLHG
jgi:pimeloyl-ACP methyl ester carboxylesterase